MDLGRLLDAQGNTITIAKELGRGGEGAVFDVAGRPDTVAKVYLKPPSQQHAAKLSAMAGMASKSLLKIAAWPTGTLHSPSGAIAGFTMPKVGGHKPIFQLYLPKPRLQEFPKADWRFLIHAAANTARAFATVHSAGLVIGDVNHGNLVVADDATVQMIDCDSFQVSLGGNTWFCTVGVGTHQPPEMQGRDSYAGIIRTPNHDNFGLAVIIFQLLCMARHPFAGRFLGTGEPPSIEEAITAFQYAYSRDRSRTKMEVPPGSLPIDALTPELQNLFENAFAPGASRGGRPAADLWISALGNLATETKLCRTNGSHFYRKGLNACPWCAIESANGVTLFPVVFVPGALGSSGMAALWQEVGRVAEPPVLASWPPAPTSNGKPSPRAREAAKSGKSLRLAAWASVAVALATAVGVAPPGVRALLVPVIGVLTFLIVWHSRGQHPGPFRQNLISVRQDWEALRVSWAMPSSVQEFVEIRSGLSKIKTECDALPNRRADRLRKLNEKKWDKQLEDHLDQFLLVNAKIAGIGQAKVATLASHGIDTAGDIIAARVLIVPGFGPTTVSKLIAWRRGHEGSFSFNPAQGVSQSDISLVERDIAAHRSKLEQEISVGLVRLKTVSAATANRHRALHGRLLELEARYAQTLADVAAVPEGRQTHIKLLIMSSLVVVAGVVSAVNTSPPAVTNQMTEQNNAQNPLVRSPPQVPVLTTVAPLHSLPDLLLQNPERQSDQLPAAAGQPSLTAPAPSSEPMPTPIAAGERVMIKHAANIRAAANNTAPVVRTAPPGAFLNVFGKNGSWLQVGKDGPWGWIFSGLVEISH